jgi:hypothetical protein
VKDLPWKYVKENQKYRLECLLIKIESLEYWSDGVMELYNLSTTPFLLFS